MLGRKQQRGRWTLTHMLLTETLLQRERFRQINNVLKGGTLFTFVFSIIVCALETLTTTATTEWRENIFGRKTHMISHWMMCTLQSNISRNNNTLTLAICFMVWMGFPWSVMVRTTLGTLGCSILVHLFVPLINLESWGPLMRELGSSICVSGRGQAPIVY